MPPVAQKLDTRPNNLRFDEIDRTVELPEQEKPSGKRYAGFIKRNVSPGEYLKQFTHLFNVSDQEVIQSQRAVIPGGELLGHYGGVGNCSNLRLEECYTIGTHFPKVGHGWSQEGEANPVLTPDPNIVATNGGQTASNLQRHREYYRGIMSNRPSDYWFFGNYGSLYFSYSNEIFSVDGGMENGNQNKFKQMYSDQNAARAAFKGFYPYYYDLGLKWHAHLYVRYLPTYGIEHSVIHMLKTGKRAFPGREGSLHFWAPVESVTGSAFSTNWSFGSETTDPPGKIYQFEHAVLAPITCMNIGFLAYMEVESLTLFEDNARYGENPNNRLAADGFYRGIPDDFFPAGSNNTSPFPYPPNNTPNLFGRQPWACNTATSFGVNLAMRVVNYLGGSHSSYVSEFMSFRLDGGEWVMQRVDGQDILYRRGSDYMDNGFKKSGAKGFGMVYRSLVYPDRRVAVFVDPDGPFSGYRKLEMLENGNVYDLGMYEARDLHIVPFSTGNTGGGGGAGITINSLQQVGGTNTLALSFDSEMSPPFAYDVANTGGQSVASGTLNLSLPT